MEQTLSSETSAFILTDRFALSPIQSAPPQLAYPPHWLTRLSPILYITLLLPHLSFLIAQDDGTDIEFSNVGFYTSDAGEIPKRT